MSKVTLLYISWLNVRVKSGQVKDIIDSLQLFVEKRQFFNQKMASVKINSCKGFIVSLKLKFAKLLWFCSLPHHQSIGLDTLESLQCLPDSQLDLGFIPFKCPMPNNSTCFFIPLLIKLMVIKGGTLRRKKQTPHQKPQQYWN